jgi:endogenous inhibitor of DNA gyrase (YacG/DUF329 family)
MGDVTFNISSPFRYRFECEHCGKMTEWLNAEIRDSATVKVGFLENKDVKRVAFEKVFWENTYPQKKQDIENGEYGEVSDLKGKCPNCGKNQSWEAATTPIGIWAFAAIISPLIAFFCLRTLISGQSSPGFPVLSIGFASAVSFPISIIILIWSLIKRAKIANDSAQTEKRNKPEFDWLEKKDEK